MKLSQVLQIGGLTDNWKTIDAKILSNPFMGEKEPKVEEAYRNFLWQPIKYIGLSNKEEVNSVSAIAELFQVTVREDWSEAPALELLKALSTIADKARHGERIIASCSQQENYNEVLFRCIRFVVNNPTLIPGLKLKLGSILSDPPQWGGRFMTIQQVNCCNVMGAGLADKIAKKYPNVKLEYTKNKWTLGETQFVPIEDGSFICNLAGQHGYGPGKVQTDFSALAKGLQSAAEMAKSKELKIYIPFGLGSGLAGGQTATDRINTWKMVQGTILRNCPEAVIVFKPLE